MKKRGQFYLIGAIIVIAAIIGFAAVSNVVTKKSSIKIYDVKDELQIEGGEVLEYCVTKGGAPKTDDFIEEYQKYQDTIGEDRELYFIYGDVNDIYIISFKEIQVTTKVVGVGEISTPTTIPEKEKTTVTSQGEIDTINVIINEREYPFELKPGENFFFVISQEVEGEQHIVTG